MLYANVTSRMDDKGDLTFRFYEVKNGKGKHIGSLTCSLETLDGIIGSKPLELRVPDECLTPDLIAHAKEAGFACAQLEIRLNERAKNDRG
jgi:hypothetical protein